MRKATGRYFTVAIACASAKTVGCYSGGDGGVGALNQFVLLHLALNIMLIIFHLNESKCDSRFFKLINTQL